MVLMPLISSHGDLQPTSTKGSVLRMRVFAWHKPLEIQPIKTSLYEKKSKPSPTNHKEKNCCCEGRYWPPASGTEAISGLKNHLHL